MGGAAKGASQLWLIWSLPKAKQGGAGPLFVPIVVGEAYVSYVEYLVLL